eukprot:TRINITY_DN30975_c0_g1_i1.p1 TRINITY_DN30975_c0_g1~~TRINITY_DN30975_c0_g1_i1.p1  ORF type:complete len:133 (-),score=15.22 TRINITY_DN30975_c0_g1_i1:34-432(-)
MHSLFTVFFFFFTISAPTEIYTILFVGSVRCVQETVFALICFLGGALFNPICIAPTKISSHVVTAVSRVPDLRYEGRVLLVGNSIASAHPQYYVMAGGKTLNGFFCYEDIDCLLYTSPSPRDRQKSRMPSSA